jgi:hypothetical protein
VPTGVDHDLGLERAAVREPGSAVVRPEHPSAVQCDAVEPGVEVRAQPVDMQDGVLPAQGPLGTGDRPAARTGGDGGHGQVRGQLVRPGGERRAPRPPRVLVHERGPEPEPRGRARKRPSRGTAADDEHVRCGAQACLPAESEPPSIRIVSPVIQLDASDTRNPTAAATSSGTPSRFIG